MPDKSMATATEAVSAVEGCDEGTSVGRCEAAGTDGWEEGSGVGRWEGNGIGTLLGGVVGRADWTGLGDKVGGNVCELL